MAEDLAALERTFAALVADIAPDRRRRLTRALAAELRRAQAQRIAAQVDPDGVPFEPRKSRGPHRRGVAGKAAGRRLTNGAGKAMFRKLRGARYLKARSDPGTIEVGFFAGRAGRIARVHQEGLRDKVDRERSSVEATYPVRRLLGLAGADRERLLDRLLAMLA